jgi:outer membrane protein insertion porin family
MNRDVERLEAFFGGEGYLDAEIEPKLKIDDKRMRVEIEFVIDEGNPVVVDTLEFDIRAADLETYKNTETIITHLSERIRTKPGQRHRDADITNDIDMIRQTLAGSGYPFVRVSPEFDLDRDNKLVKTKVIIEPSNYTKFGEVIIQGNELTSERVINKQLRFSGGDEFNHRSLQRTQRSIQGLGMFQYVTVRALLQEVQDDSIPVEIVVRESNRWVSKLGVGYGREEKLRLSWEGQRFWFLGGARRLQVFAKTSQLEPYYIDMRFIQPAFIDPLGSLVLNPFLIRQKEPAYSLSRFGSNLRYQQQVSNITDLYLNFMFEQIDLEKHEDVSIEAVDNYDKAVITFGFAADNSYPPFSPTGGNFVGGYFSYSGFESLSDYHYYKALGEMRFYRMLFDPVVIAAKGKIGLIEPIGANEVVPIEERYFSGGSNSIRGWARAQVGPTNQEGEPIGGNSLIELSLELRIPIYRAVSTVMFTDFGNVWRSSYNYNLNAMQYSAGGGLRIGTPVGPVRIDLAAPLYEKKPQWQYYITIGQAF